MNREAVNVRLWKKKGRGGNSFQTATVDKLEETIKDILIEYRMKAFAQQLDDSSLFRHGRYNRS